MLIAELGEIRSAQGNIKQTRSKIFEQVKTIQEGVQKKVCYTVVLYLCIAM